MPQPAETAPHKACGCSAVSLVGEEKELYARKLSHKPLRQMRRARAVVDAGWVNQDGHQKTECVGDDVALPAFDTLASIEASWTVGVTGVHRLVVDVHRRRTRGMSFLYLRSTVKPVVKLLDEIRGLPCRN